MPQEAAASFYKLREEITCSVCLQELNQPVSITCGHTFCRACISTHWATTQLLGYSCPECRKVCPRDQLIPVFRLRNLVTTVQQVVKEEEAREGAPVQLVYTDDHGKLQVDESAVQRCFLDHEVSHYPVCLICVIGEKRRGKSMLMNYILRALLCQEKGQPVSLGDGDEPLKGFEWSTGTDTLTKGVWMWSRPFVLERNGEKMAVFVLDTEGSLDIEGDRETSIKLSSLSMLLSSYLIFNINTCLKTTELDYLEMYLHVSELTGQSFSLQYLQHLDILVRDWQDPDHCGREAALAYIQHETERLRRSSHYHRVLETLRSPSVSGFILPYPGKCFLRSCHGKLADMDDDFRTHLTRYISDLVGGVWLHRKTDIRGEPITCAHLGQHLKGFVGTLQNKNYSFGSPIQMFHSLENHKNTITCLSQLHEFMNQQAPVTSSPFRILGVTTSKMRDKMEQKAKALLQVYKSRLKSDSAAEQRTLEAEMKSRLKEEQEKLCSGYSKRFTKCAIGLGCAVGGVILGVAGGALGAVVAGTVLAVEAAALVGSTGVAVVTGAIGGSVTMGAIGSGIGAGVGSAIGHKEERKTSSPEEEDPNEEGSCEDTQQLVAKHD